MYEADIQAILSHRHDQGADLWTTPDRRIIKGAPFSTAECIDYLLELGVPAHDPVLSAAILLVWSTWQPDGRFKVYPSGQIQPCQTAIAASMLCRAGFTDDERMAVTFQHLLDIQQPDGGWRCNKFFFGRGPETEHSNPLPTLNALDAFRCSARFRGEPALSRAVDFLLRHWDIKIPIGPCHYGIGTLFMQLEYPRWGYSLLPYVYVLSFYDCAREDARFQQALAALKGKLVDGQLVVERVVPKLAKLAFCQKGRPSELATRRYQQILDNLNG